ncbi:S24 family peptidase [Pontixanthobacter sp.]|uniref:S24 family peptidase n=1 Tax=Pontixanthobacter sp. TaxID=2792078 RepID=UPI003C7CC157
MKATGKSLVLPRHVYAHAARFALKENASFLSENGHDIVHLLVTDNSMAPTLQCGDCATVIKSETVHRMQDRIWAVQIAGRLLIRRIHYTCKFGHEVTLTADNVQFDNYSVRDGEAVLIGRVASVARPV